MPTFLSPHFTLEELTRTDHMVPGGNIPTADDVKRLTILATTILEPVREMAKTPIMISSGFRNETLNTMVHGEQKSAHLTGRACDFVPVSADIDELFTKVMRSDIPYDKIILEQKGLKKWIHIQIANDGNEPRKLSYEATVNPLTHVASYREVF